MKIGIINSNLIPGGKLTHLVETLASEFEASEHETDCIELGELDLPACDGRSCYADPKVIALTERLAGSDAIVIASPVYNYDLNAAAKNLIELTGSSWKSKTVGVVCSAGGERSYLSPVSFINSLGVDYRCLVSPRFVYAARSDFQEDNTLPDESPVRERLQFMARELPILVEAATQITALSA